MRDDPLEVGAQVFLRNRVHGRRKIQDHWRSEPHNVVGKTGSNTYVIEALDVFEETRTIHRQDLLKSRPRVPDIIPASTHAADHGIQIKEKSPVVEEEYASD